MEFLAYVRQYYDKDLSDLEKQEQQLRRERSSKQKKAIEQQIGNKVRELFQKVQQDFPSYLSQTQALTALYQELTLAPGISTPKLRTEWQQSQNQCGKQIQECELDCLANYCEKPDPGLALLPTGSWFLQFSFSLAKPYISHDDDAFYLIDNPVSKDRVFGLPIVRPSSWKGNLRSALRLLKQWNDDQTEVVRLFGNAKGTESDFCAGRLNCYPTFFREIGLEIINPHDRARKVGKNPILIESVPADAEGTFSLLYVPFDLVGREGWDEAKIKLHAKEDLAMVAEAVRAMMLVYGFSAKRTSGYGTANDEITGMVRTRSDEEGRKLTHLSRLVEEVAHVAF